MRHKGMSIRQFIALYRTQIDETIKSRCLNCGRLNDDDRRLWILNDEGLYLWAKSEGVNI